MKEVTIYNRSTQTTSTSFQTDNEAAISVAQAKANWLTHEVKEVKDVSPIEFFKKAGLSC